MCKDLEGFQMAGKTSDDIELDQSSGKWVLIDNQKAADALEGGFMSKSVDMVENKIKGKSIGHIKSDSYDN